MTKDIRLQSNLVACEELNHNINIVQLIKQSDARSVKFLVVALLSANVSAGAETGPDCG
jgi:hypothetical protein